MDLVVAAGWVCILAAAAGVALALYGGFVAKKAALAIAGVVLFAAGLGIFLGADLDLKYIKVKPSEGIPQLLAGKGWRDLARLAEENGPGVTDWGKLMIFRVILRSQLQTLCASRGIEECQNRPNVSFERVLDLNRALLDRDKIYSSLDRLRVATHYTEWASGTPPNQADIKFVFEEAPKLVKQLNKLQAE